MHRDVAELQRLWDRERHAERRLPVADLCDMSGSSIRFRTAKAHLFCPAKGIDVRFVHVIVIVIVIVIVRVDHFHRHPKAPVVFIEHAQSGRICHLPETPVR